MEIIDMVSGPLQKKMRLMLDWHIYVEAIESASGIRPGLPKQQSDLGGAVETIAFYASDSGEPGEITNRMRLALDKYVFNRAEEMATGVVPGLPQQQPNLDLALEIVEKYASSPERAKAMLRELGFM